MKNLVIVESPTKARTIGRYLGDDYTIKFSMGHIMDLPKSKIGVDVDHNFDPQYEVIPDKKKIIAELKSAAKSANTVILATDPDREGEAIAANIKELLDGKSKDGKFKRIVFHEITEQAIKEALLHPRDVDVHLVDAQTARRVLDRLVGYKLSPLLWQKVRRGLSAGRVQSVALRLIVEREREIEKFVKEPYFTIHATFRQRVNSKQQEGIEFELIEIHGERLEKQTTHDLYDGLYKVTRTTITTEERAKDIVSDIQKNAFSVTDVQQKETRRTPFPPYTTSTLQQDASRRFGYPGKRTMSLAQKLYEEGYITYHRTDSVVISQQALTAVRSYIQKVYGGKYLPEKPRSYATKQKLAQEAHEAIRPTNMNRSAEQIQKDMGKEFGKLYDLIWRRTVASQMADAIIESTTVYVESQRDPAVRGADSGDKKSYRFKANGSVLLFDGFLKVNPQALQDTRLPKFIAGESLDTEHVRHEPHETPPPPRYNDASLIATLEDKGIGRPSTYAAIISTLTDRGYVERVERRFEPTSVGVAVNDFLVTNFSEIDDVPFTAQMEDDLDEVASGKKEWEKMMKEFYTPFEKKLGTMKDVARVKIAVEETDVQCPECREGNLVVRTGKFGKFFSCNRFPDCKFTKPYVEETNLICPKDNGKIIVKKTRKGRKFYGCGNYPACTFAAWKLEDIKKG